MEKILFFCYTPFQCIAAMNIKYAHYRDVSADIILCDSVLQREQMKPGLLKTELFERVIFYDARKLFPKGDNKIKHEYSRIRSCFDPVYLASGYFSEEDKYDLFVTTEVNYVTNSIFALLRRYNSNLEVALMDEGYSSYTYYFREALNPVVLKNKIKKALNNVTALINRRPFISKCAKKIYLYDPELICWDQMPYEAVEIIKPDSDDTLYYQHLNQVFEYDGIGSEFDKKYIYFEESFFWSMKNSNDIEIINQISDIVGKDNMQIKMHPRNMIDRFTELGYKVNKSVGMPWEIVAMNLPETSEKVFITFSSGAALNYRLLFGKEFKTVLLYKCVGDSYYKIDESLKLWFEKFAQKYSESLYIPNNMNELISCLSAL